MVLVYTYRVITMLIITTTIHEYVPVFRTGH
jgi:hypothetical protein